MQGVVSHYYGFEKGRKNEVRAPTERLNTDKIFRLCNLLSAF